MPDKHASTNARNITAADVGIALRQMDGMLIYQHRKDGTRTDRHDIVSNIDSSDPTALVIRTDGNKHFRLRIEEIT